MIAWPRKTVWYFCRMIGMQNPEVATLNPNPGTGVRGAQLSSTNQLINAALGPHTQTY